MTASRITRVIVALASAFFAGIALTFWLAPEVGGDLMGLKAVRAAGTAALRADLGGLFAGLAVLCAVSATTRRRSWTYAAVSMIAAVVIGRCLNWIASGRVGPDVGELAIEAGIAAALLALLRTSTATSAAAPLRLRRPSIVVGAVVILPVVGGAAALLSPSIAQRVFERAAAGRAGAVNTAPLVDDALRVAVCGSSAPLPSVPRAKACVAVFAGGKFYVVDTGPESVENLVLWGIPLSKVGAVLLTHFHSDHIGDLGELNLQTWAGGRPAVLDVYGGPGVERVVEGFNSAYRLDQGYRTAHHTERVMPSATWAMVPRVVELDGLDTPAKDRTAVVLKDGDLTITAVEVDHAPITPAYAYRFDYRGRSTLVTGDLKFNSSLARAAKDVDVLVSEAIATTMTRALGKGAAAAGRDRTATIMHDIEDYHITPEQAASIANDANVGLLVFYHLLPSPDGLLSRRVFSQGMSDARRGDWIIADDGSLYTLPVGSDDVRIGRVVE